ncbi:CRISPR-associated endonuclease Cas3'' [Streptomyces spiramenti]|uniref:CRISPR-associated endonuclease Cas3 n=1 Tax=Streptomyces spiramenti TaxID=2720606 RepID=A0ABX1ANN4_9ACTN|nr:CRISPR-associated endonuclease Cas3'' [Streptomyces spiramenti]NJP65885.1 CRISPR-associated endonuclease Cas3'' [Streptomyces spiramenti]
MSLDPRIWGKSAGLGKEARDAGLALPLVCHLLDTAAVAEVIWDQLLTVHQRSFVTNALEVTDKQARTFAAFWAGLHDIGKIRVPFQLHEDGPEGRREQLAGEPGYAADIEAKHDMQSHEAAAHWWLLGAFKEVGYPSSQLRPQARLSHAVAQLLGGHGGRFHPTVPDKKSRCPLALHPGLGAGAWEEQRRIHFDEVRRVVGATAVPHGRLTPMATVVLAGVVTLADWLASIEEGIRDRLREDGWAGSPDDLDSYWRVARAAAPGLLQRTDLLGTGFRPPPEPPGVVEEAGLGASMAGQVPDLVSTHGPGMVVVTAPPSAERTEAALGAAAVLGHAAGARGLFYALPTGSAADGHMAQVNEFAAGALAGPWQSLLLHSSSRLKPAEATEGWALANVAEGVSVSEPGEEWVPTANSWLNSYDRALLAAVGTGTVDELLQAVMPVKFNVMRLFALSGKVVVLDEVHARGAWGQRLMPRFLEWAAALRIPVVLATTAADASVDAMLAAYRRGAGGGREPVMQPRRSPGWSFVGAGSGGWRLPRQPAVAARASTLGITVVDGAPYDELQAALAPIAAAGRGRAVVYRATPAEAIRTFHQLMRCLPVLDVTVVHEQMSNKDRWDRLAACGRDFAPGKGAPGPSVLVTTAMLQHVRGLCFDLVVSGPAPLADLMARAAQSVGDRPRLSVLRADSASERDDAALLCRTGLLLGSGMTVALPEELPSLLDEVYAEELVDNLGSFAARELQQLDNRRRVDKRRFGGTAGWLAVPGPCELDGDLGLLSRGHPGAEPDLLSSVLGEELVHVVCGYPGRNQQGDAVTLLADDVPMHRTVRDRKRRTKQIPLPGRIVSSLIPVPKRLVEGMTGDANDAWRKMPALANVLLLKLREEDGEWVYTTPNHRFRMTEHGLTIDQLS